MKIALVVSSRVDPNQGVPGATIALAEALRAEGAHVDIFFLDDLKLFSSGLVNHVLFPFVVGLRRPFRHDYDVVDIASGDAWVLTLFPSRPLIVARSHGLEHTAHIETIEEVRRGNQRLSWKYPLYHGGYRLWEVKTSMRRSDLALLLNKRDFKHAISELGVSPDRAHIVTNGVPDGFLGLQISNTPNSHDGAVRIAQVGSYIPRKGIHYAAQALNSLMARYPQVSVTFVGTGCTEARVFEDYNADLHHRITVMPRYDRINLPHILSDHHIKLFPSLSEGFSLALVEAMACGLAPVAAASPGPTEIIEHDQNGLLVPPRDAGALEQALDSLISDRGLLDRLRQSAYSKAQGYSWRRIARDTLRLYEHYLSNRGLHQ